MVDAAFRRNSVLISWATVAGVLLLWAFLSQTGMVNRRAVPAPYEMGGTILNFLGSGYEGVPWYRVVGDSLFRVAVGFCIGSTLGILTGVAIGTSPVVASMLRPLLGFMRPVPMIAFIPIVILLFGIGEKSEIAIIVAGVFFMTSLNTAAGVAGVPRVLLLAGRNLGFHGWRFYRYIVLPAATPAVMNGLRLAAAVAWLLVVAAEMVSAQTGVGYMIVDAANFFRISYVYLGVLIIGVIGLGIETLLAVLHRKLVHWEGQ